MSSDRNGSDSIPRRTRPRRYVLPVVREVPLPPPDAGTGGTW